MTVQCNALMSSELKVSSLISECLDRIQDGQTN